MEWTQGLQYVHCSGGKQHLNESEGQTTTQNMEASQLQNEEAQHHRALYDSTFFKFTTQAKLASSVKSQDSDFLQGTAVTDKAPEGK